MTRRTDVQSLGGYSIDTEIDGLIAELHAGARAMAREAKRVEDYLEDCGETPRWTQVSFGGSFSHRALQLETTSARLVQLLQVAEANPAEGDDDSA